MSGPIPQLPKELGMKRRVVLAGLLAALVGAGAAATLGAQQTAKPPATGDVTFSKDVAPILQRSCQNCHRPDGVAPMSLVSYEDVRPWSRAIKQRTSIGPRA